MMIRVAVLLHIRIPELTIGCV